MIGMRSAGNTGWFCFTFSKSDILGSDSNYMYLKIHFREGDFCIRVEHTYIRMQNDVVNAVLHDCYVVGISVDRVNFAPVSTHNIVRLQQDDGALLLDAPPQQTIHQEHKENIEFERFKNMIGDLRIEGQYKPMEHQFKAAYFKATNRRAFDLSTMRTGKTGSTILSIEYLFRTQQISKALILCPLSCVRPVWYDAIKNTIPNRTVCALLGGTAKKLESIDSTTNIIITNYESIRLPNKKGHTTNATKLYQQLKAWLKGRDYFLVIDECTAYANLESQRTRSIKQFINETGPKYQSSLTGTPGHDPIKAFAMSKVGNPQAVSVTSVTAWQNLTQFKKGPAQWQWQNRSCAPEMIKKALSPAILFKKDDLFDLPPIVYTAREAEPTVEQKQIMEQLKESMVAVSQTGELITAQQKSALISKLLQCACGAVYADGEKTIDLDTKGRNEVIKDLIDEATGKTVIFSAFTGGIQKRYNELTAEGLKCAVVDGSTSEKKRTEIFSKFLHDPKGQSIDVLIAHPRTTAFGVELASADMMIFDGAPLSGDFVFGQAVERLSSLKQKAKQITIAQVYSCYAERKVFCELLKGQSQSAIVADLFKSVTEDAI